MKALLDRKSADELGDASLTEKFYFLFHKLIKCIEAEQRNVIEEMKGVMEEMERKEYDSFFSTELFNELNETIEKQKMSLENTLVLLKHIGYCKVMKEIQNYSFDNSSLGKRFEKLILEEDRKKEREREKFFVDLCESYLFLRHYYCKLSKEMTSICVSCLLKVALNKIETEETQKEVEMALLALGEISVDVHVEKELFLKDIEEIIKYHQEHRNLTQFAYQSAWQFLIIRFIFERSLEEVIVNELHFVREAARELEELSKRANWRRKAEETKRMKEVIAIEKWIRTIKELFVYFGNWREECVELIHSLVTVCKSARENVRETFRNCISLFHDMASLTTVSTDCFTKGGVFGLILEEIQQSTLEDVVAWNCSIICYWQFRRLEEDEDCEIDEVERKTIKKEVFDRIEEEGYEDIITSFHETFEFFNNKFYMSFSTNIVDYFVNI
ncbi:uncharacterized protein MONOS_17731 [Monocercomonoides exilis]|uniref:uncharacterized protein n=1 Tax=Monocercomonoides exilis TaxID=2049356 RepID=UPI00355ACA00|nr:hypothetical protein MONOS_17731 [Monocercomonoides exilis]